MHQDEPHLCISGLNTKNDTATVNLPCILLPMEIQTISHPTRHTSDSPEHQGWSSWMTTGKGKTHWAASNHPTEHVHCWCARYLLLPQESIHKSHGSKTSFDAIQASKRGHSCSFRKCTSEKKVKERNRVPLRTNPSEFSLHLVELT